MLGCNKVKINICLPLDHSLNQPISVIVVGFGKQHEFGWCLNRSSSAGACKALSTLVIVVLQTVALQVL